MMRQNGVHLQAMHQPRRTANALLRVAAVEVWRLELFSALQQVTKVKGIRASCHANLLQLVLLDGNLPRSAPAQSSEPHIAVLRVVLAFVIDSKPRSVLRTGRD